MLKKRFVTALWGIPLLVAAVWFDQPLPWFTLLIAVWGILSIFEFYRLVSVTRVLPLTYFVIILSLLIILSRDSTLLSTIESYFDSNLLIPLLLTLSVLLPLIGLLRRREKAFISWGWTVAVILYVGWLLSYLVALRGMDGGRNWVFFVFLTTFASDTTAFFIGKALGRHRLAPSISPGKTWEGAIGGIVGSIIISLFFTLPTPLNLPLSWGQEVLLGVLVCIFGQLGDLVESLFKRNIGVKDSSQAIPGHGGFLDRMDSILFAGVVVYYYVIWAMQ